MVTTAASVSATRDNIVDVLAEERVVRDGNETLDSSRQLTVSLSSGGRTSFSPFGKWGYKSDDSSASILVEHGSAQNSLGITLHRTIRVPDNADTNSLPPSLGSFPLFRVSDYAHRLPDELAHKGGIFFPMYQSEAMWMAFRSSSPFALKIYVGGVNAVSGFPMVDNDHTREKRARMLRDGKQVQDYVVTPDQPWLDGIVSEDGKIRQFVAQPKGSGFSVEAQVTGEEKVGGIQIEIIPIKKNFPHQFDVRYEDKQGKVLTRTIVLADRGLTRDSTWADVKKIIREEFDIAVQEQALRQHTPDPDRPGHHSRMEFTDSLRLGDVYFPPRFSTLSVQHAANYTPPLVAFGGRRVMKACAVPGIAGYGAPAPMALSDFAAQPQVMAKSMSMYPPAAAPEATSAQYRSRAAAAKPKVKEMGLAAGGLIKQTINPDPNPADIWDHEAAVMLHLQIFDPASYSDITGNPPPPTPATQDEYAKRGWPYFELWNEETTGIKGDFAEVKSVAQLKKERALAAGEEAPPDEESVPVRVVTIGKGRVACFKSTFKPLEVLRQEVEKLTLMN